MVLFTSEKFEYTGQGSLTGIVTNYGWMKRNGTLSRDSHDYQGQLPRIEEEASGFSMIIFFNGRPKHKAKAPVINYALI